MSSESLYSFLRLIPDQVSLEMLIEKIAHLVHAHRPKD
jgi:hypothetical protein